MGNSGLEKMPCRRKEGCGMEIEEEELWKTQINGETWLLADSHKVVNSRERRRISHVFSWF
jgi:hypothetical protein